MICRNCGAGLEASGIDQSLRIITCSHCGSLHDMPNDNEGQSTGELANAQARLRPAEIERKEVALPKDYKVHRTGGGMQITWPVGGLFHGLILLIIAGGCAYIGLTEGLLILVAASIALLYFAAVRAFNKHRIRMDGARLEVTQGPLPWAGNRKLNASDVKQIFSTEYQTEVEKGNDSDRRVEVQTHYQLLAQTESSGQVTLLRGFANPHQALWLEQEIEKALGIRNKRVAGEHWQ